MINQGDLARAITHESNDDWPQLFEFVAYFGGEGRRGKRRSITITADQYFGRGQYHAPMTGDQMLQIIEKLRKQHGSKL